MTKRRYYYMSDQDFKGIENHMKQLNLFGKGKHERFMEMIARNKIVILFGDSQKFFNQLTEKK